MSSACAKKLFAPQAGAYRRAVAPKDLRASAFGLHAAIAGISLLPAPIIAGFLWEVRRRPEKNFIFVY